MVDLVSSQLFTPESQRVDGYYQEKNSHFDRIVFFFRTFYLAAFHLGDLIAISHGHC